MRVKLGLALLIGLLACSACATELDEVACERLRELSCGCFSSCQPEDIDALEEQSARVCNARLRAAHARWSEECSSSCQEGCSGGWGVCAQTLYREVGLEVRRSCESVSDAGAEGGSSSD